MWVGKDEGGLGWGGEKMEGGEGWRAGKEGGWGKMEDGDGCVGMDGSGEGWGGEGWRVGKDWVGMMEFIEVCKMGGTDVARWKVDQNIGDNK